MARGTLNPAPGSRESFSFGVPDIGQGGWCPPWLQYTNLPLGGIRVPRVSVWTRHRETEFEAETGRQSTAHRAVQVHRNGTREIHHGSTADSSARGIREG